MRQAVTLVSTFALTAHYVERIAALAALQVCATPEIRCFPLHAVAQH